MIVDGILNLLYEILAPAFSLLPVGSFPIDSNAGQGLRGWLFRLDYVVPFLDPVMWFGGVVATTAFAFLGYRLIVFLYSKIRGA